MPTRPSDAPRRRTSDAPWTFLTNHAHVLVVLAGDPDVRLRDVAARVGITERGVQSIVADLERAGVLTRTREGRRNSYTIHGDRPLRHPVEAHRDVASLLALLLPRGAAARARGARATGGRDAVASGRGGPARRPASR